VTNGINLKKKIVLMLIGLSLLGAAGCKTDDQRDNFNQWLNDCYQNGGMPYVTQQTHNLSLNYECFKDGKQISVPNY